MESSAANAREEGRLAWSTGRGEARGSGRDASESARGECSAVIGGGGARAAWALCAVLIVLAMASGCAVGPRYHPPVTVPPAAFKEAGAWVPAQPADHLTRGPWWESFGDTLLDRFEGQVEASSYTLASAEAQYREALALAVIARSGLFPSLEADASAAREKSGARSGLGPSIENSFAAGLSAAWEVDLWGRLRRTAQAGRAQARASAADLESARLSLHALVAATYFSLRTADADQHLIRHLTQGYQESLQFTQNQYQVGVAARSDIDAAVAQLKQVQAQGIDLGVQRAQYEHALAVLLGKMPEDFGVAPIDSNGSPPTPPPIVPSELLERRPDVAAAERRLAAASAGIGVAVAGYFPSLTLSGSAGYQGSTLSKLFSVPSEVWAAGPAALAETIFEGGRVRAGVAQARALYDESLADYRQTVLGAFQEVEDDLAAIRILAEESEVQQEAITAARQSLERTLNQYRAGTVSQLNVITVQATLLDAERAGADLAGRRLQAAVDLYKATGGDWQGTAGGAGTGR